MYASSGAGGDKGSGSKDGYNKKKNDKNVAFNQIPTEVLAELVGNAPAQKNLKGVVIAVVVIVSILGLIGLAIILLTPRKNELVLGNPITFTEAMTLTKHLRQLKYQWLSCNGEDVLLYLNASSGDLMRSSFSQENASVQTATLLSKDQFSEGKISGHFVASRDCQTVLVPTKSEKLFRHSSTAIYKLIALPKKPEEPTREMTLCPMKNCEAAPARLKMVQWGYQGTFLAFVYNNDIYYTANAFDAQPVKITNIGADPAVSVGTSNWVYEEEILESSEAVWISPENRRIAYLVFNDSRVDNYDLPVYGSPANMYLQQRPIRYPKAGAREPLTQVTLRVFDVSSNRTAKMQRPPAVPDEHYVTLVRWLNSSHLLAGWVDRNQSAGFLAVCDASAVATATAAEVACRLFYSGSQPAGWMDFNKQTNWEPIMDAGAGRIFTVLHNSGYRRIAVIRLGGSNQIGWVTPAQYDVADILHYNSGQLHFLSCREKTDSEQDATKMHVHRIAAVENAPQANCISCIGRDGCEFNRAAYSASGALLMQECLGPSPYQYFVRQNSYPDDYPVILNVELNEKFKTLLLGKNLPRVVFRKLKLRDKTTQKSRADPLEVNAKLVLPRQLNESHISQYPLVLKVYGGPFSQMVTRKFDFGWQHYLASSLYIMSASIDGRGTANRGSDYMFAIKNNFANVELEDQMDSLAALRRMQFVNKSCVAVFGWSYGGFMTLHMLGHEANANNSFVSTGVAVAPVTDFHYYNTGYTERYLGVKSDSTLEYYKRTNVSRLAANFWNKDLLLVHGTGDDNVHYQNSAQLVKILVQENVDLEFATYPDEDHSMRGAQSHLFLKITGFLLNSFNRTSERKRFLNSNVHKFCRGPAGSNNQC